MNTTPQNTPFKQTEIGLIPQDWEVKRLGEVIINVEYGSSAKSKPEGKVPVLRMGNIQNGKIDWTDLVYTEDDNEIKKYLLKKDDVLFNRTNTVDLVGKTGIYKGPSPPHQSRTNRHCHGVERCRCAHWGLGETHPQKTPPQTSHNAAPAYP